MPYDSLSYLRGVGDAAHGQSINDFLVNRRHQRAFDEQQAYYEKELRIETAGLYRRSRAWRLTFDEFANRVRRILFPGQVAVFDKIRKEAFPSENIADREPFTTEDDWNDKIWTESRLFKHLVATSSAYQYWYKGPPLSPNGSLPNDRAGRVALAKETPAPPPVQSKKEQTAIVIAQQVNEDLRKEHAKRFQKP